MLHSRRRRRDGGIPTSSLADIAFLLLIFFLVTTVFDQEKGLSLVLPPAGDTVDVPPGNVLVLTALADGIVEIRRGRSPLVQRVTAAELAPVWRTAAEGNPSLIAVVQTHPDAPYRRMVDVLDALRGAGAERISLRLAPR